MKTMRVTKENYYYAIETIENTSKPWLKSYKALELDNNECVWLHTMISVCILSSYATFGKSWDCLLSNVHCPFLTDLSPFPITMECISQPLQEHSRYISQPVCNLVQMLLTGENLVPMRVENTLTRATTKLKCMLIAVIEESKR